MIKLKKITIVVATLAALTLGAGTALAANLIINGDFEDGDTGFTSAYLHFDVPGTPAIGYTVPKSSLFDEGTYGVGTSPSLYHALWADFGDKTSGSGNMMIVNGAVDGSNITVWSQTIDEMEAGVTYTFSAWLASSFAANASQLAFSIDGVEIGDIQLLSSADPGTWQLFSASWFAKTNDPVLLSLVDKTLAAGGNDFAIDFIAFDKTNEVPEPASMLLFGLGLFGLAAARRKFKK